MLGKLKVLKHDHSHQWVTTECESGEKMSACRQLLTLMDSSSLGRRSHCTCMVVVAHKKHMRRLWMTIDHQSTGRLPWPPALITSTSSVHFVQSNPAICSTGGWAHQQQLEPPQTSVPGTVHHNITCDSVASTVRIRTCSSRSENLEAKR